MRITLDLRHFTGRIPSCFTTALMACAMAAASHDAAAQTPQTPALSTTGEESAIGKAGSSTPTVPDAGTSAGTAPASPVRASPAPALTPDGAMPATPAASTGLIKVAIDLQTGEGQYHPDERLRIVKPDHKSADLALLAFGAMLGSFRLPASKENYHGTKVEGLAHPALAYVAADVEQTANRRLAAIGVTGPYRNPIVLRPDTFTLVYDTYTDEHTAYRLTVRTTASRKSDQAGWLSRPVSIVCKDEYEMPGRTLEDWSADDYALVRAKAREHARACTEKITASIDRLLDNR